MESSFSESFEWQVFLILAIFWYLIDVWVLDSLSFLSFFSWVMNGIQEKRKNNSSRFLWTYYIHWCFRISTANFLTKYVSKKFPFQNIAFGRQSLHASSKVLIQNYFNASEIFSARFPIMPFTAKLFTKSIYIIYWTKNIFFFIQKFS